MPRPGTDAPTATTAVCTIVSRNYLHYAKTLLDSVRQFHPQWRQHVLLVDQFGAGVEAGRFPFHMLDVAQLPLPHLKKFLFRYTILELNTAVKPWYLQWLLTEQGYDRVIYIDPDIRLYAPLCDVETALDEGAMMVLTPHLTAPMTDDLFPDELQILKTGCFNLGFLALAKTPASSKFLAWWQSKLELDCRVDLKRGLFVDQKWIDLVPGMFERIKILFHPGYNVAYWNLAQRPIQRLGAHYQANGRPLAFFHFSGLTPENPAIFSKHQERFTLNNLGDARDLVLDYCTQVQGNGLREYAKLPYAYGRFADGSPITDKMRLAYREDPQAIKDLGDDPFVTGSHYFPDLREKPPGGNLLKRGVKKSLRTVVRLLPEGFKSFIKGKMVRVMQWAGARAVDYHSPLHRRGKKRGDHVPGLNIVGGAKEPMRLSALSATTAGLPFQLVDLNLDDCGTNPHWINLFHVSAEEMDAVHERLGSEFFRGHYNIGYWTGDLPQCHEAWAAGFQYLDEVWAPTRFAQETIVAKSHAPVLWMPPAIQFAADPRASRAAFAVPENHFLFLTVMDFGAEAARQNLNGTIAAFRKAFPDGDQVGLVVHIVNAQLGGNELVDLRANLQAIRNIHVLDRTLTRQDVHNLEALCDGHVSLHHAAAFGLRLAECMVLKKPVVATNWSGNVDFMNAKNACLVDYVLVAHEAGQWWAEPDLDQAAWFLRKLVAEPVWRQALAAQGQKTIDDMFSPHAVGQRYQQRLAILDPVSQGVLERRAA